MYKNAQVAVVVPAYNEERLIGRTLDTMPDYVDKIVVVDDCSRDGTTREVEARQAQQPERIVLLRHTENGGVGAAMATGYKWCRDQMIDVAVRMDGDAQMDPADMQRLLDPIVNGSADYTKGNRLFTGDAWTIIPKVRYLGNSAMSLLTKIASGYWHVADSQTGYTAINLKALQTIDWDLMYKHYGQPNDLLVRLNIYSFRVCDVPVKPVYNIGEKSGIKPLRMIPKLSWLLFKLFLYRMWQKYVIRDFHPLVFFYTLGITLGLVGIPLTFRLLYMWVANGRIPPMNALAVMFAFISASQFILFAMWFDMEHNRDVSTRLC